MIRPVFLSLRSQRY